MNEIKILETGPRDGLQNEKTALSLNDRFEFIKKLSRAGLKRIELGSFVSPKWVPQMKDTAALSRMVFAAQEKGDIPADARFAALTPNLKGLAVAMDSGLREVTVFAACTDTFSKKNINCSVKESFAIYKSLCREALSHGLKIRAYLSACFFCPYEGRIPPEKAILLAERLRDLGVYEVAISDTTGAANPFQIQKLLTGLSKKISLNQIAGHFHDVHGMGMANVWAAYQAGIRSFDGSAGGLGGCPYTKSPAGNVATEGLFYLLESPGSPAIKKIIDAALWLEKKLGRRLPSPLLRSPYFSGAGRRL